ncbi:hypothetical protein SEPCBS119000_002921 [Sporothrix epigloea]|uniref:SPRY domain-containing protein n=1 Tax=Sporothrix epigloea TaxID=1892477 RepID=A0ABP0DIS0_9PEZI
MCFGSRDARGSSDVPPRPAPLPASSRNTAAGDGRSTYDAPPSWPPQQASQRSDGDYAPPPGPPPSWPQQQSSQRSDGDYAPPPGPPPGHSKANEHDWEAAVPDTSLLPPPPDLFAGWDRSPVNNASEDEAEQGKAWCFQYPINSTMNVQNTKELYEAIKQGNFNLQVPPTYQGTLDCRRVGVWAGETRKHSTDSCIVSFPPLYAANLHSPSPGKPFSAYYEVHIAPDNRKEVSLAIGFTALPYPPFRLPGWHRGSLAVHGDDGHRYVNDTWGGKELVDGNYRFIPGGKYGIGITFTRKDGAGYGPAPDTIDTEVIFTDNGRVVARWDLHEEIDAERDLPVTGLEGDYDLSAAIGTFDAVKYEVHLSPENWAYQEMKNAKLAEMKS